MFDLPVDANEYSFSAHTHIEVSAPNPLDVYYAIMAPGGSEYVLGPTWSFEVDHSGSIRSMGETEEFVESLRKSADAEEK